MQNKNKMILKLSNKVGHLIFVGILFFALSCGTKGDVQTRYILPDSVNLRVDIEMIGSYTDLTVFSFNKNIDIYEISDYPKNILREKGYDNWGVRKWHKPSEREIIDIQKFINKRLAQNSDLYKIKDISLRSDDTIVSYVYKDSSSIPGGNRFSVDVWMELYILESKKKRVVWVSQGKF